MTPKRIFIVEDELLLVKDLSYTLTKLGYEVAGVADNGRDAVNKTLEARPDLVLMDIMLKGDMNGLEAAKLIHEQADIPIIYLTAYADKQTLKQARITGPYGYLLKPYTDSQLYTTIEVCLNRHGLEQKLRESEKRLGTTLNSIADGVISLDSGSRVTFMNPVAEKLSGWKAQDALGRNVRNILLLEPGDQGGASAQDVHKALVEGTQRHLDCLVLTNVQTEKQAFVSINSSPIKDRYGNVTGSVLAIRDITWRVQTRMEQLRLSEAVNHAADHIIITDPVGFIQYVNPSFEKLTGYTREEVLGKHLSDLAAADEIQEHQALWENLRRGRNWLGRLTKNKKNNTPYEVEATVSPVRDQRGAIINFVAVERDISYLTSLEKKLNQARKMEAVGTLAGGIAHDFNNLLTPIIVNTELALEDLADQDVREDLKEALTAAYRARDLVKQILAFSRSGEQKPRPLSVVPIVKETMNMLRASLPSTIDIRKHLDQDRDVVMADPTQIHQILMNLCTNAAHAMQENGGVLSVALDRVEIPPDGDPEFSDLAPGMYLKLSVADTGHGIPENLVDRIFDPFFSTKKPGEGTGMGLAMVHGIVASLKGKIAVKPGDGSGCTFEVHLPLVEQAPETETQIPTGMENGGERVLVVDDEDFVLGSFNRLLTRLGYKVQTVNNSEAARDLFSNGSDNFDLLITDQTMPRMTGLELAQHVLKIRPGMPIILCTGYNELVSPEQAREIGIRAFVTKPIIPGDLARTVRRVLNES